MDNTLPITEQVIKPEPIPLNFFIGDTSDLLFYQKYFVQNTSFIGRKDQDGKGTGLLNLVFQYNYQNLKCPYFIPFQNISDMEIAVSKELQTFNETHVDGSFIIKELTDEKFHYQVEYNRMPKKSLFSKSFTMNFVKSRMQSIFNSIYLQYKTNRRLFTLVRAFPFKTDTSFNFMDILGMALFPFSLSFLFPIFLYTLVMEKENKLKQMMKIMGLKEYTYFIVTYLGFLFIYCLVCGIFIIIEVLFRVKTFYLTHPLITFLIFFLWGNTQVVMAFFFSLFIKKSNNALSFGYLFTILVMIIAEIFCATIYRETDVPIWFWLVPPFVFYRCIFIIFWNCFEFECISNFSDVTYKSQLGIGFIALSIEIIVLLFAYIILNFVTLKNFRNLFNKIKSNKIEPFDGISIVNLDKTYNGSTKKALNGLNLQINKNEIFALLGPNGAGKSSLLKILYGLESQSSGSASIFNLDINTNRNSINQIIGVSPQFDIVWDLLTIREHLQFYSRIKGTWDNINIIISQVGLENHASKLVRDISGGMKRRLSLAISLIGNPKAILLDEPTTGLDPESKREVWDCISNIKENRSILLTTHSMEEVTVLCNRIGILVLGELQCVGTLNELKNQYGNGYKLNVSFIDTKSKDFIFELLPSAKLVSDHKNNFEVLIPKDDFKISKLFRDIEDNKKKYGILDWGISQTTIEDVFMNVVQ